MERAPDGGVVRGLRRRLGLSARPAGDARRSSGGTGLAWDYAEAAGLPTAKPVLLAGGIGPDNVRAALAAARPWGIDVCSRVESAPGIKDPRLLEALFKEVRHAEAHPA